VKQSLKPKEERELTEEELVKEASLHDAKFGPLLDQLSITDAFARQRQLADELHVSAYKTPALFHRALRNFGLTKVVHGFSDEMTAKAKKAGTTMSERWRKLGMPEELLEKSEVTSPKALRTLFKLRSDRRRELDRERKADKASQRKISKKSPRNAKPLKTEDSKQKPSAKPKERKLGSIKQKS